MLQNEIELKETKEYEAAALILDAAKSVMV